MYSTWPSPLLVAPLRGSWHVYIMSTVVFLLNLECARACYQESTLHLALRLRGGMQIFAKALADMVFTLDV